MNVCDDNRGVKNHHNYDHKDVGLLTLRECVKHTYEGKNHKEHRYERTQAHIRSLNLCGGVRNIGHIERILKEGDAQGYEGNRLGILL